MCYHYIGQVRDTVYSDHTTYLRQGKGLLLLAPCYTAAGVRMHASTVTWLPQPTVWHAPQTWVHGSDRQATCCSVRPAGHSESLTHSQLAKLLLSLKPDKADSEAQAIMARLNFKSTYAFSKLLTEQMVDDPSTLPGVPKVIVRPSLVFGAAAEPFPG